MAEKNSGLTACSRYSYPPNSLSLCGPVNASANLNYYSSRDTADSGTREILSEFSTLYPYLSLIAHENNISDPFDLRVVEAYWLGNSLLNIPKKSLVMHLTETLGLKKKLLKKDLNNILNKFNFNLLPHHSFHVLNIHKRTGHLDIPHTVETMDACLVNWGTVEEILPNKLIIKTHRLKLFNDKLNWEQNIKRKIKPQGEKDRMLGKIKTGDVVSYHWGMLCGVLTARQLDNLKHYTNLSLSAANYLGTVPMRGKVPF